MAVKEKTIYVYDDFSGPEPLLIGYLYITAVRGGESCAFEYNDVWLKSMPPSIFLDPELMPFPGRQYPYGKSMFGMFADSTPDRWGRILMDKRERIQAEKESRKPKKLYGSDYLIGVCDETRMGGLRFKTDPDGPFMSDDMESAVPPMARLRALEEASRNFENVDNDEAENWLNQLLSPGSSLGGARPKASVVDEKGELWIAKFPSKHDENDIGAWEKVVHDLAVMCGLNVPEARLERLSRFGSTYLVRRFDREGKKRIHYASAMTLLGQTDGASAEDGISYLDIASFIKSHGAFPKADLMELWKRIVFSMYVSNTDDHLRNHAFLLTSRGWSLSPMFDVNPEPYGNELSLNVNETDNRIRTELALSVAERFEIRYSDAEMIACDIRKTISDRWKYLAETNELSRGQIESMAPAFHNNEKTL